MIEKVDVFDDEKENFNYNLDPNDISISDFTGETDDLNVSEIMADLRREQEDNEDYLKWWESTRI